jgi:hypothetical protein
MQNECSKKGIVIVIVIILVMIDVCGYASII